jgi:hypothetical protein
MMGKVEFVIPPTREQGSCTIIGTSSLMETAYQNALWQYNSGRAHDGLTPVNRLPEGTRKGRVFYDEDEEE